MIVSMSFGPKRYSLSDWLSVQITRSRHGALFYRLRPPLPAPLRYST